MNVKKLLAAAMSCLIMGCQPLVPNDNALFDAAASSSSYTDVTEGAFTFRVYDYNAEIIGFSGMTAPGELTVPSHINGRQVNAIASGVFQSKAGITSIIIPDSITKISGNAFAECPDLVSVKLPDMLTFLGLMVFYKCPKLTSINLPSRLRTIGEHSFGSCVSLTAINVDEGNSNFCSVDGVLYSKDMKTLVQYPTGKGIGGAFTIPEGVEKIGAYAFEDSLLSNVNFTYGVKEIGSGSFGSCSGLTAVELPDSIQKIGYSAFVQSINILSVRLPESACTIGNQAFAHLSNMREVTIPANTVSVAERAFAGCYHLEKVTILSPDCKIGDSETTFSNRASSNEPTVYSGVICGYEGSTAQEYAQKYARSFVSLGAAPVITTTETTTTETTTTETTTESTDESTTETITESTIESTTETTTETTTESTTDTTTESTVTTEPVLPDNVLGDIDGDGMITAYDASLTLKEYTDLSSGRESGFDDNTRAAADIDEDNMITAYDASLILTYYTYLSGNPTIFDMREWYETIK